MRKCINCGKITESSNETVCSSCGGKLAEFERKANVCPACGSVMPEGVVVCPVCGNNLYGRDYKRSPETKIIYREVPARNNNTLLYAVIIILFVIIVAGAVVGIVTIRDKDDKVENSGGEAVVETSSSEEAKRKEEEERLAAEEEAKRKEEEASRAAEEEALRKEEARREAEEKAKRKEEEARRAAEEKALRAASEETNSSIINCSKSVTLRASASTGAADRGQIPNGAGIVYKSYAGNGFCRVSYRGEEGYVLVSYVDVPEYISTIGTAQVVKCNENITLRLTPSKSGGKITSIPLGAYVDVIGKAEGGFYCVKYGGRYGFALAEYLDVY